MLILTITADKTIPVGGTIVWDRILEQSNCDASYRNGLYARLNKCGEYDIHIEGNVTGPTPGTPVVIDVLTSGYVIPQARISRNIATANVMEAVSRYIGLNNCPDTNQLNLINAGTTTVTLNAGFTMYISKHKGGC